ncbi:uncharacterized protein EI90DRAFT_3012695 [Cantharellus anzutake]|uniref:uncharacterized protein n=1 Tax=Cantharellus anzutake TaxID=1750568 RepID=UPI0019059309|nr:uncharacterized protein EI90DRAFT_3012695 [Cantharellus anzutake]KAF8339742.1 hypothetical protein EI90DRAFT_3012695 [Cantharellus anzutake]
MVEPGSFDWYREELQRAADEHVFGVATVGRVREYTEDEKEILGPSAEVPVKLLEGNSIIVRLTQQGYSVVGNSRLYTTLDHLFRAISPKWNEKREEDLIAMLDKIVAANDRD